MALGQLVDAAQFGTQAQDIFLRLTQLTGWKLDDGKRQDMAETAIALGARAAIRPECLRWTLSEDKAERWLRELNETIETGYWTGEEAGKWAGRLQWGTSLVWGRAGRAYLRPLYWHRESGAAHGPLTRRHLACLRWWQRLLQEKQSRDFPWDDSEESGPADLLVFTDAEGDGGAGAIVYATQPAHGTPRAVFTAGHVPPQ